MYVPYVASLHHDSQDNRKWQSESEDSEEETTTHSSGDTNPERRITTSITEDVREVTESEERMKELGSSEYVGSKMADERPIKPGVGQLGNVHC